MNARACAESVRPRVSQRHAPEVSTRARFPAHVAEALLAGEKVPPEKLPMVSPRVEWENE